MVLPPKTEFGIFRDINSTSKEWRPKDIEYVTRSIIRFYLSVQQYTMCNMHAIVLLCKVKLLLTLLSLDDN